MPRLISFLTSLLLAATTKAPEQGSSNGGASPAARRLSPDYAEGNGPEIALVLLESLLRAQLFRKQVWREEVKRLGDVSNKKVGDDEDAATVGSEQGLIPELVQMLRLSLVPAGSAFSSSANSPAGSGATTPSRLTTATSSASTLIAGGASAGASRATTQLVYQIVLSLWLLSFDDDIAEEINVKFGVIPVLVDVARNAVKEKVVRVAVATLRNLLAKASDANASAMLGSKVLPLTESLLARKWSDEEIEEDLEYLKTELSHRLKGMSTFDEYLSELSSGQLTFENPAHELDDFWKENAPKLVEKDGEVLKQLVEILKNSQDSTTLAVACSDVGKFVTFFEPGKKRVGDLGAKVRIMDLMSHQDPDVKFRALNTVSKLVSASWR